MTTKMKHRIVMTIGMMADSDDSNDDDNDSDDDDNDSKDPLTTKPPTINIKDEETPAMPLDHPPRTNGSRAVAGEITGVGAAGKSAGAGIDMEAIKEEEEEEQEQLKWDMDTCYGPRQHSINLRDQKPCLYDLYDGNVYDYDHALLTFKFLMEQMSLKKV